ncbi:MAG: PleD family two-component system response regulator [Phycisphaerales bacterium JB052]
MPTKVLIADDDHHHLDALKVRFEAEGFEVYCAQDSYHAVRLAKQERPDAVVLDINMPAGDGFSVQERLGKMDSDKPIPVIYLTGERSQRVETMSRALNAFAVIYKPSDSKEIIATVNLAISFNDSAEAA